ncbi:hypothetical protein QYF61_015130 [Mycteria americana]|uniref:Uncharacterized protein n=1 Tax=Mycteria americana TaxID=33587 RepID=A0AAN7PJU9_MYCAM|nr:hypothetical protein QYF61_015130 [Mycteria americana]
MNFGKPNLEYYDHFWAPLYEKDIDVLDQFQWRLSKMKRKQAQAATQEISIRYKEKLFHCEVIKYWRGCGISILGGVYDSAGQHDL